jgi:hypothetical protein
MKEYFVVQYAMYQVEFFRDYINGTDIWYDIAINIEGVSTRYRMHNDKNQSWKITGRRNPPSIMRLEEDFCEAICRNEAYS